MLETHRPSAGRIVATTQSNQMSGKVLPFQQPGHPGGTPASTRRFAGSGPACKARILQKGEHLCHAGDRIAAPYMVVAGVLMSYLPDEDGNAQTMRIYMAGDVVGFEALVDRELLCSLMALDQTKVLRLSAHLALSAQGEDALISDILLMGMFEETAQ